DLTGRQDDQQPFEAFTVPVPVADPGPDGVPGSSDDGAPITAYQVSADRVGLPPLNVTRNIPDTRNEDWTFELSATRRLSGRWSMTADFSHLWTHDNASGYLGQPVRANAVPVTPNDFIHADDNGRHVFRVWSAKVFGTVAAPWGISVTPMLRHQSGQPFGRTIVAALNYSRSVRILAEPIGTRRMDAVTVLDVRVEKSLPRLLRHSSVFVDVFNALNANPATTISWSSDAFQRPLTIMSPRIVRLGVRIVW
ncbi:MAG TPA: hypothetical protein VFO19_23670, partial [Vicinamibacterales bacterium]|nr:hypothetical protein [Vicinamibacterales bacterium]